MLNILALASIILQPIFSLYPNVNFPFQKLLHRVVLPRLWRGNVSASQVNNIKILWSRIGGFDIHSGSCFDPNHFVLLVPRTDYYRRPTMSYPKKTVN